MLLLSIKNKTAEIRHAASCFNFQICEETYFNVSKFYRERIICILSSDVVKVKVGSVFEFELYDPALSPV